MATDGSVRESITGYEWLASTGQYGLLGFPHRRRQIGTDPVLVAELRAIDAAVRSIRYAPLTILSDSRSAVRMVRRWMAGDCVLPDGYTTDLRSGQAGLIQAHNRIHAHPDRIDIQWRHGHQGDPLNEGADALARLASRCLASKGQLFRGGVPPAGGRPGDGVSPSSFGAQPRRASTTKSSTSTVRVIVQ